MSRICRCDHCGRHSICLRAFDRVRWICDDMSGCLAHVSWLRSHDLEVPRWRAGRTHRDED